MALIFLSAFFWAQRSGQNDDLYTPSMRILLEDEVTSDPSSKPTVSNETRQD
jgi:cbb3-type cytochrome oxidase maturation protein